MKTRPSTLIIQNDQVLSMRYNYAGQDVYNLPSGIVEFGESLENTLARELEEELGLKVSIGALLFVAEIHSKALKNIHFVFVGSFSQGRSSEPKRNESLRNCLASH